MVRNALGLSSIALVIGGGFIVKHYPELSTIYLGLLGEIAVGVLLAAMVARVRT